MMATGEVLHDFLALKYIIVILDIHNQVSSICVRNVHKEELAGVVYDRHNGMSSQFGLENRV